ncbi:hypothetical protein ACLOJK_004845 [Asimina triloba]
MAYVVSVGNLDPTSVGNRVSPTLSNGYPRAKRPMSPPSYLQGRCYRNFGRILCSVDGILWVMWPVVRRVPSRCPAAATVAPPATVPAARRYTRPYDGPVDEAQPGVGTRDEAKREPDPGVKTIDVLV